jgi:hypothetical protein
LFSISSLFSDGQITNLIFYGAAVLFGLFCFGVNIENLVIGAAGLLVSFAFMIGAAASKYLEVRIEV